MCKREKGWVGLIVGLFFVFGLCVWAAHVDVAHATTVAQAQEVAAQKASSSSVAAKAEVKDPKEATASEHEASAEGEEEGIHITHAQVMDFIWRCLNFALLIVILVKFGKDPVKNFLQGRSESIKKEFDDLEEQRKEAERKYEEYRQKLADMDKEAEKILQAFIKQGEAEKEKIIAQAYETAERIKAQAKFYVQQELAKAREQLKAEVADMAVKLAEDIIRKNITEQDHHRLIAEYLERVVQKN